MSRLAVTDSDELFLLVMELTATPPALVSNLSFRLGSSSRPGQGFSWPPVPILGLLPYLGSRLPLLLPA